jgi:hypothetical protein
MQRRKLGFWGSSALSWTLGFAVAGACNVYDSSLLTGGSGAEGGTSGKGGSAAGGNGGSSSGAEGGGTSGTGTGGKGGSGATGGTDPTGGTGTGGNAGTTGNTGGTDPTGGDGGDPGTGGDAGSASGSGGKGGSAGDGGSTSGGSGGSAGDGGSGGVCGKCGCGKADTPDTDMDGVLDCIDMCMGHNDADCAALRGGLVHRYSFSGTGTAVMDTKGTAHGTATGVNAALSGSGTMVLTGGAAPGTDPNDQYVDLPDNLLMGLTNATFEAFITWPAMAPATASNWQRIFDFGTAATSTAGTYIFLTPRTTSTGGCRAAISTAGASAETAAGGAQINGPVITAGAHHFVLIIDDAGDTVSLYVDGTLGSTVGFTGTIASVIGTNNWLGRSNYSVDPYFGGVYDEFRVYNVPLTVAQLRTSRTAGPDATFF